MTDRKLSTKQMTMKIVISFFVIFVLYPEFLSGKAIQFNVLMFDKFFNQYDESLATSIRGLCALGCFENPSCLAFAYNNVSLQCYLYNRIVSEARDTTTDSEGWMTFVNDQDGINLALNKPTLQSSTLYDATRYASNWAVDGLDETYSHTSKDNPSWWCVDLQSIYNITHVVIWNTHGNDHRIRNFEMRLSPTGCSTATFNSTLCYRNDGRIRDVYTVSSCTEPSAKFTNVRSVYILVRGDYLHMREVAVYSNILCP